MNKELLSYYDKEIQDLLDKKLIKKSKSLWSCFAFYVQKQTELERGTPRLIINYKPLNDALSWIRRPIPNKTTFVVPLGHYEWNEMPFDLKDTLSEFQNIIDENFNQFSVFIIVFIVKSKFKTLPCLGLVNPKTFGIVETDASDIGYGRILKQSVGNFELLVRYTS